MGPVDLEVLFDRFRRHGDSAALAEVFDRTAPEVLRVAMHLAASAAEAEDLVQSTFLAAIESAESFDRTRPLVPWLLGILANLARKAEQSRRRQPDHGRLSRPRQQAPDEAAEHRELSAELARVIDGLPEPYRGVLVLHLKNELSATEIAYALGRSPGTVRSQISRGMQLVRQALPASLAGALLVAPVRGLAAIRTVVVTRSAALAAAKVAGITGALAMKKTTALVLGLALLVTTPFLVNSSRTPSDEHAGDAVAPLTATVSKPKDAADVVQSTRNTDSGERRETAARPSERFGSAVVRLRWSDDGTPVIHRGVRVYAWDAPNPRFHAAFGRTDEQGLFHARRLHPGRAAVYVSNSNSGGTRDVVAGENPVLEFTVERVGRVTGRVVDAGGRPAPGAEIWVYDNSSYNECYLAGASGADGSYSLEVGARGGISARKPGHAPSYVQDFRVQKGGTEQLELHLRGGAATVVGTVRNAAGQPMSGVHVLVGRESTPIAPLPGGKQRTEAPGQLTSTASDGTFRVEGVAPGIVPVQARATGYGPWASKPLRLAPGQTAELAIVLREAVVVSGHVRDTFGNPIVKAWVGSGAFAGFGSSRAHCDASGKYRLQGLTPNALVRAGVYGGGRDTKKLEAEPGQTLTWDPVLNTGRRIHGRVVDEFGAPLAGWSVNVDEGKKTFGLTQTDASGRFAINNREDIDYHLEVRKPDCDYPVLIRDRVRPRTDPLVLTVPAAAMPSSYVVGRIVDGRGKLLPETRLTAFLERTRSAPWLQVGDVSGRFRFGPWPAGRYRMSVQAKDYPELDLGTVELEPGKTRDLGMIRLLPPGFVRVTATDEFGKPLAHAYYSVDTVMDMHRSAHYWGEFNGKVRVGPLAPGKYLLQVKCRNLLATRFVEVRSGHTTELTLHARATVKRRLFFVVGKTAAPATVEVLVRDEQGTPVDFMGAVPRDGATACQLRLPPGKYRIEATTEGGLTATRTVELGVEKPLTVALK